jgi:hypothetical protein
VGERVVPALRVAGEPFGDTRQVNPGEVWEENGFWIGLSWRIDPDGSLGIRRYHEPRAQPGEKLATEERYGWMFENSLPGLPERAAVEGLSPLARSGFPTPSGRLEFRSSVPAAWHWPGPSRGEQGG